MFALPVHHVRAYLMCLLCLFFILDEAWPEVFALPLLHARQSMTWGICLCAWLLPACLLPCLSGSVTAENSTPSNVRAAHHPNQNKEFNSMQKEKGFFFFTLSDKNVTTKTNTVTSAQEIKFHPTFLWPWIRPKITENVSSGLNSAMISMHCSGDLCWPDNKKCPSPQPQKHRHLATLMSVRQRKSTVPGHQVLGMSSGLLWRGTIMKGCRWPVPFASWVYLCQNTKYLLHKKYEHKMQYWAPNTNCTNLKHNGAKHVTKTLLQKKNSITTENAECKKIAPQLLSVVHLHGVPCLLKACTPSANPEHGS